MSVLAGRYTLQRELGGGGEARTWLASDRMTRSSVAVKVTRPGSSHRDRLRAEWQTGIRLMHAHIARVFEFHDDEDGAFYSRQFIDGPAIGVLSRAPLEHILGPVALIADALRYAHARDVVHRDVKADNILLDANGAPYLIDFGVAASTGAEAGGGSLIASSPQQLAGEPSQPSDDIFALGGLVYELVTGQSPYSSASTAEDISNLVPARLSVASDGKPVPAPIAVLVARMLEKDAGQRPDAAEVVEVLQNAGYRGLPAPKHYVDHRAVADDEVIEASVSVSPLRRETPRVPPSDPGVGKEGLSPRSVGIALAVLVALLIGVVFVLPKVSDERSVEEPVAETATDKPLESDAGESDEEDVLFNENINEFESDNERLQARSDAELVLGQLLSQMDTLEQRAVRRWGGVRFAQATEAYEAGDAAYLEKDYTLASRKYAEASAILEPLLVEVDEVFRRTLDDAVAAFEAGNTADAVRLFELAVAISPNDAVAIAGYERARNLETVLSLVQQAESYEKELELDAALVSFERAVELDPEWQPAIDGIARVQETIRQLEFDQRMTEGLVALEAGDYQGARAAFTMAKSLKPESREPSDGLLQVDQGLKLGGIASLERTAYDQERGEQWKAAVETYESILKIDPNLSFAQQGLGRARSMAALHDRLEGYIAEPDVLSRPSTMQSATRLVVDITRMQSIGPRLEEQRDELTRLLKRAATPLRVQLVSDNVTDVSIYRVGKLGTFANREVELRPGTYVAVGSRPGYRDVRLEFRVAPEIDMQPITVRCEEAI